MPPPFDDIPEGFDVAEDRFSDVPSGFQVSPPTTRADRLRQMSFGQRLLNDLGILGNVATSVARGVPEGAVDLASPLANPAGVLGNMALPGDPFSTDVSSDFSRVLTEAGVPEAEGLTGAHANQLSRGLTSMMAGAGLTNAAFPAANTATQAVPRRTHTLRAGQREGLVAAPAEAGASRTGSVLEGISGTLKTRQLASQMNQPVINRLAARAVGISDDALTPQALQNIRREAGDAYKIIRGVGRVQVDGLARQRIGAVSQSFRNVAAESKTLAKANKEIIGIADDLAKPGFDANTAIDFIKALRDRASEAFRAGRSQHGSAYRAMSDALEDSIERDLVARGPTTQRVVEGFRAARQLIAKTHTIEDAMKGDQVSASILANMLGKGAPLVDELKLIARFAQEFPKSTRLTQVAGSTPPISPLDVITATTSLVGAGVTGSPSLALPAVYALSRPVIRNMLLRPTTQQMLSRGVQISPSAVGGASGLFGTVVENAEAN